MNTVNRPTTALHPETLQARFGLRVAARLSEQAEQAPHDISERLRFAREQALRRAQAARAASTATASAVVVSGRSSSATLAMGGGTPWWVRLASLMPLIVLVGGLVLIEQVHDNAQINAAADIDTQLLSDDLPPAAYSDPGFVEFLKTSAD